MKDKLVSLIGKIDSLSLRERVLVLLACLVVIHQLWDSLVWRPLVEQEDRLLAQETTANETLLQTRIDLKVMTATANRDPDQETKKQIQNLQSQLASVRQQMNKASASLISPVEMAQLLEKLLTSERGLELLSLQTLQAESLIKAGEDQIISKNYQVYRHGFTIEFTGGYLATLRYLEALEKLPYTFFWDGIDYQVDEYPNSKVRLNLYTLSISEGWIGV